MFGSVSAVHILYNSVFPQLQFDPYLQTGAVLVFFAVGKGKCRNREADFIEYCSVCTCRLFSCECAARMEP